MLRSTSTAAAAIAALLLLTAASQAQLGELPPTAPGGRGQGAGEGEEGTIPHGQPLPPNHYAFRGGRVVEISFRRDGTHGERVVPGSEVRRLRRADKIPRVYAADALRTTLSTRPRRLAPGERGALYVVVEVVGDAVVLPGARVRFEVGAPPPPAVVGRHEVVEPALRAGSDPRGRMLQIRADIEIPPRTAHGEYPVVATVELEVHDQRGVLAGMIACEARGTLHVGPTLRPAAIEPVAPRTPSASGSRLPAATAGSSATGAAGDQPAAPVTGNRRMPSTAPQAAGEPAAGNARHPDWTPPGILLALAGLGIAASLLVVLLARR